MPVVATRERIHGGADARGAVRWDLSTCANSAGPCPHALQAVAHADPTRYPDPAYAALRTRLAAFHDVEPARIVVAASASEFIQRITAVTERLRPGPVGVPRHGYGDYAHAAHACRRATVDPDDPAATLVWYADPSSPRGETTAAPASRPRAAAVLDAVYAPLVIDGSTGWNRDEMDGVFTLHSPNKALGMTGIRGAYAVAPRGTDGSVADICAALGAAEPSWPLGAHAVALLESWTTAATQRWLDDAKAELRHRKRALIAALDGMGIAVPQSATPFVCVEVPAGVSVEGLRRCEVAVRDTASFGLPGRMRVNAPTQEGLAALIAALSNAREGDVPCR